MGETSHPKDNKRQTGMKTVTQKPNSIKVTPQEHVFQLNTPRIEEHPEVDIIKDTMTMLKGLATLRTTRFPRKISLLVHIKGISIMVFYHTMY